MMEDRVNGEFVRAIGAVNARLSSQMGLIQKLQRTSNYDEVLADLQSQIDDLKATVEALVAGFDVS